MRKYSFLFLLLFFGTALSTAEAQEGGVYHSLEEAIKADPKKVRKVIFDAEKEKEWVEIITSLRYVETLIIRNMQEFSPEILKLPTLKYLSIMESSLTTLPVSPDYSWLHDLIGIKIKAQLTSLPDEFARIPALKELLLEGNQLTSIPCCVGELKMLKKLDLRNNKIEEIPCCVTSLPNLTELFLQKNKVAEILDCITNFLSLERLNLNDNQIKIITKNIGDMKILKLLDLKNNQITVLPKEISNLYSLKILDLTNNPIADLPKEIKYMKNFFLSIDVSGTNVSQETIDKLSEGNPDMIIEK